MEPRRRSAVDFDRLGNVWGLGGPEDQQRLDITTRFITDQVCDPPSWSSVGRCAAHPYRPPARRVREMAPRYGFGFVDGWEKISQKFWPGVQVAAYLSSYFVRGKGRKPAITENVKAGDLPKLVLFVSRDLTQRTGARCETCGTVGVSGRRGRASLKGRRSPLRSGLRQRLCSSRDD